ncbi:hypothetical protein ACFRI7_25855 [Streptomyces sp. NPDC056716]|uniref:hypothetical protein n=1 Tax=unclassified Streptomyces TaxID=2593676 RepID=UPI003684C838
MSFGAKAVRRHSTAHSARLTSVLGAALLCTLITSCGGDTGGTDMGPNPVSATAERTPPEPSPSELVASVGSGGEDETAQEEALRERAAEAPVGDPVAPQPYDPDDKEFQDPFIAKGDVTVYLPTATDLGLIVPVAIRNQGTETSFYDVLLNVTGPGGFDVTLSIEIKGAGLTPNATWPTELTAADPGKPVPAEPDITIVKIDKQPNGTE